MAIGTDKLVAEFKERFHDVEPAYIIYVPGRVNLIGEHLDYNGLPVLPMALDRGIYMVVGTRPDQQIDLANTADRFPSRSFKVAANIPPYNTGDWGNYVKAGVQGIVQLAAERGISVDSLRGFAALASGDLPAAAGLSSSSALVVASALAFLAANNITVSRRNLADRMSVAETYVGTMGGGMDHAAILLSDPGAALLIDFFPLRTQPVPVPTGYSVVVCNSMVAAPKTAEARIHYNRGPLECKLATQLLRRMLEAEYGSLKTAKRIADLLEIIPAEHLMERAIKLLGGVRWGRDNTAAALGIDPAQLDREYLTMRNGDIMPEPEEGFRLLPRVRHVLTEGERVRASVDALTTGDGSLFGRLMNDSHTSCRDDYRISCSELEALVAAARSGGAVGSRLTGAGFGGCCVSLVPAGCEEQLKDAVISLYYEGYLKERHPELHCEALRRGYDNVILVGNPMGGARLDGLNCRCPLLLAEGPDIASA